MTTTSGRIIADTRTPAGAMAVSLRGLRKSYRQVRAVTGIDLVIPGGQTVALGRNGAGKSTILSVLPGRLTPDAGKVRLFGRTPADAIPAGLVGAMPQEGGLIPPNEAIDHRSLASNVHAPPRRLLR
jgi:ABC-2 type transport system ATP-binding protein